MLEFVIFGNKVHSYPLSPNYTGYVFLYTGQCICKATEINFILCKVSNKSDRYGKHSKVFYTVTSLYYLHAL